MLYSNILYSEIFWHHVFRVARPTASLSFCQSIGFGTLVLQLIPTKGPGIHMIHSI